MNSRWSSRRVGERFSSGSPPRTEQGEARSWIQRQYRSFDGIRGVAILMVFFNHYLGMLTRSKVAELFWPGVDLFFVLSGFLITGILVDSVQNARYFRDFYVRRALRIFPLYYGFFGLVLLLRGPLHLGYQPVFYSNLLYISNLTRLHPDLRNPTSLVFLLHPHYGLALGPLWSLCVEEQFYLVWPLVVFLIRSRRTLMRLCAAGTLGSFGLRCAMYWHSSGYVAMHHAVYFWTPTRCDGLLIGAFLALWLREVRLTRGRLRQIAYRLMAPAAAVLVVGQLTVGRRWPLNEVNPLLGTYGYTLIDLVAAGVLLRSLDDSSWVARLCRIRFLAATGVISYGFYFFHGMYRPDLLEVQKRIAGGAWSPYLPPSLLFGGAFAFTWLLAWASFRFYEAPWLRWKDRLAPPIGHGAQPSPFALRVKG